MRNCACATAVSVPCDAAMRRLPISSVTFAVPIITMSFTVFHAFGDSRSVGEMKLPAALLITMLGKPNVSIQLDTAVDTLFTSLTSQDTGKT